MENHSIYITINHGKYTTNKHKCIYCGKTYEQNSHHHDYSLIGYGASKKHFCSHTCQKRWLKTLTFEERTKYIK